MTSEPPACDGHLDPGAGTIGDHPDLDAIEELCSGSIPDAVLAARVRETVPRLVAAVRRGVGPAARMYGIEDMACPGSGQGSDAGDPQRVRTLAKHLHDFADDVSDALRLVKRMAGEGTLLEWAGKSADVFKGTSRMSRRTRMSSPSGRWVTEVL